MQNLGSCCRSLEKIFISLLVFLIPTQIGLHFWPAWSFVAGIRVDYLSPTIYLTDILIVGVLLFSLANANWFKKRSLLLATFGIATFALINSSGASNVAAALLKWAKILELTLFFFYLIYNKEKVKLVTVKILPFSIILFSAIGFLQIIFQRTIGGPLYFFGERNFMAETPGIALYDLFGKLLLRPYSTFPHPNVFGGYMFIAGLTLMVLKHRKSILDYLAVLTGFIAAILSGSLAVYIGMIIVFIFMFSGERAIFLQKFVTIGAILLSFAFLFISPKVPSQKFSQNIDKRISLTRTSVSMVSKAPIFGVGLNNFVVNLPIHASKNSSLWILQPVHSIFLLTFVETGILGLVLFGYLLQRFLSKKSSLAFSLIFIIVTGLFDHYWITLQQPQILFVLLLGLL